MRTAGLELQVTLVYLALLCSLGSGTYHPSTAVGGRRGGEKRIGGQAQTTAVGTGAAAPTKNRRASFVAAGVGIVGGQDYRGGQDCRGGNRLMHSPGMLGARLASRFQTQASRSLVTRVRLKGVRSGGGDERGHSTKRNFSSVTAKEVAEDGHAGSISSKPNKRSGSATAAVASAINASGTRNSRGAGEGAEGETVGKAKPGRRGAGGTVWTGPRTRFDLANGYEYAESLAYLCSPPERALKGVGPKRGQQLAKLGINTVASLLWHLPTGIIDRREVRRVTDLMEGEIATVLLKVVSVSSRFSGPTRISCVDVEEQQLDIIIFGGLAWRRGADFAVGETKVVSGKVSVDKYSGGLVMASPDIVAPLADLKKVMVVQPTYPLTSGLSLSQLKSAVAVALEKLEGMRLPPEWIDRELMRERSWSKLRDTLLAVHNPQEEDDLSLAAPTRSRLAYDELLASQLVLAMRRQQLRGAARLPSDLKASRGGDSSEAEGHRGKGLVEEGIERLPFKLTQNQKKSLNEILEDMDGLNGRGLRMFRLLQGDVGSGKTAVAFLAMLRAAEQGGQSCMLSPTEVLTAQHLRTLRSMAEGIQRPDGRGDLRVELLTGAVKGKARQKLLEDVGNGEVDILVATHAVLTSASTAFQDLGLAVVDEEQRFGVEQRDRLTSFAQHVLYLSATPIPRSLALALYGDMEVSQLREMPEGSAEITTTLIPVEKVGQIVDRLKSRDASDDKVFWVLPQINKSDAGGRQHVSSANERYDALVEQLGQDRVSLLHGKMSSAEKNKTLSEFTASEGGQGLRVLVSTSIIEVGVDVPRAGVCVVENAEMFGLSQLHQIRGRLGRTDRGSKATASQENASSSKQSAHCILLYGPDIGDDATERLKAVRATRDGFLLAERDLELRGPGEMLGVQQKGYLEGKFKLADITQQGTMADHAYARARRLVERWCCSRREAGAADHDHDESDRVEGFALLLALCGRGDDARRLLGEFSSGPRSGASSSVSGSCAQNGEERAKAAADVDFAVGYDDVEVKLPSVGESGEEELDSLSRLPSFLLPEEETSQDPVTPVYSASLPDVDHHTTPTPTEAEEIISEGNEEQVSPYLEDAVTAETLFEDEADFLARSALEHAEMMDGQWEEGGYLNPGFPISAAVEGAPRRARPEAGGVGVFPSDGVSVRHGDDQSAVVRRLDDYQETPLGAKGVHVWAGKPSDYDASDAADVGEKGEGEKSEASPEIIRRVDLSRGGHTVVLFDLETTGFRTKHDRIIQLAGKVMGSTDPKHSFSALVNPEGAYMSMEVRALTGITPEILAANGARSFREVWPLFAQWLSEVQADVEEASGEGEEAGGVVLVAHNANFDNRFLVQEQERGGFDRFMMGGEMGIVAVVDSLTILRQDSMWRQDGTDWDMPRKPDRFNLSVLFKHLYGVDMPGAHTALGDVHGLESVLSAPGISERWRLAATTTPSCQIPVPRSLEELQAAMRAGPSSRSKKPSTRGRRFSTRSGKKGYSKRSS